MNSEKLIAGIRRLDPLLECEVLIEMEQDRESYSVHDDACAVVRKGKFIVIQGSGEWDEEEEGEGEEEKWLEEFDTTPR